MKQLDKQQLEEIRSFVIKRRATYFEVIEELTDHLATAIEQQWKTNPTISFQEALYIAFKDFDCKDFKNFTKAKVKIKARKYSKLFIHSYLSYFTFPGIISTVAIYLSILLVIRYMTSLLPYAPWATLSTLFVLINVLAIVIGNRNKTKSKLLKRHTWYRSSKNNRLLIDDIYTSIQSISISLTIPITALLSLNDLLDPTNLATQLGISALYTLTSLSIYIFNTTLYKTYLGERTYLLKPVL